MTSRRAYFRQFLRAPGLIGAVTPSSATLAHAMADQVDFRRARVVVEYGPGTGVFTRELLRRLRPDGVLVAIELHPDFCRELRAAIVDPRLVVVEGSAADVGEHLERLGIGRADAVVSALPFANLPAALRETILARTRAAMAPGARFVAVQYLPFALLPRLRRLFRRAWIARYTLRNLPPALVIVGSDEAPEREPSALREARAPLLAATLAALALARVRRRWGALGALGVAALLALYRDPPRAPRAPLPVGGVLAPGEGTVVEIGAGRDSRGAACREVRIFLALWDVHVQRAPIAGTVATVAEERGGFLPAFLRRAGDANQRTTIRITGADFTCEVVQVAGMLARRIVCWVRPGQALRAGERLGMIKLGSQVVLRLPADAEILARPGQHVRAGEDVVARVSRP